MQVVGVTTQQYVYIASRDRKFRIGEILIIDDPELKPRGEVVETKSFNRFLPLTMEQSPLIDPDVWRDWNRWVFAWVRKPFTWPR